MLKKETITINGKEFCRHYSDENLIIRKVGTDEEYVEAIDLVPCKFEYEETETEIKKYVYEEAEAETEIEETGTETEIEEHA